MCFSMYTTLFFIPPPFHIRSCYFKFIIHTKKITDFIGDCIVELMVLSLYVLFPLAHLAGLCCGYCSKILHSK